MHEEFVMTTIGTYDFFNIYLCYFKLKDGWFTRKGFFDSIIFWNFPGNIYTYNVWDFETISLKETSIEVQFFSFLSKRLLIETLV